MVMTPQEIQIESMIEPEVNNLGYKLVRVKFFTNTSTLQIMIDRIDDTSVNLDDCEKVSHLVSAILDVEDVISLRYNLEISSPGIDRPLVKLTDFTRFAGSIIKLNATQMIEGRKKFKGKLVKVENLNIHLVCEEVEYIIPFALVESANIVPDEGLL